MIRGITAGILFPLVLMANPTPQQRSPIKDEAKAATREIKRNAEALERLADLIAQIKQTLKENENGNVRPRIDSNRRPGGD